MTIERVANHGITYLRLTESLGLKKVGERVVQRRKVVLSLGPLSRHDDGEPDYLLRLRESFRAGKPLIKELEPYVDPGSVTTLRGLSGEHLHHAGHGKAFEGGLL